MAFKITRLSAFPLRLGMLLCIGIARFSAPVYAQQPYYAWKIGGGVGTMAYFGDLSYRWNNTRLSVPAYTVFLERKVSPSFALQLNGTYGQVTGNDRTKNWQGNLVTANPNFGRALNFRTDIRSASLLLHYHFDNGHLFSQYSTFSPYLFAGVGITNFSVYGDLFDGNGSRYYYWSDQTVRNRAEGNGAAAAIIEQDGKYETKLTGLNTEGKTYPTTVWSIPAGIGVKVRLTDQLSANLQVGVTYAFTDYLDDVSGSRASTSYTNELQAYAANPSGATQLPRGDGKSNNDLYVSSFITLSYHFGYKQKNFKAPMVYTGYKMVNALVEENRPSKSETLVPLAMEPNTQPVPVYMPDQMADVKQKNEPTSVQKSTDRNSSTATASPQSNNQVPAYSGYTVREPNHIRLDSLRRNESYSSSSAALAPSSNNLRTGTIPYSSYPVRDPGQLREENNRGTAIRNDYGYATSDGRYRSGYGYSSEGDRRRWEDMNAYNRYPTDNRPTYVPVPLPSGGNNTDQTGLRNNTAAINQLRAELADLKATIAQLRTRDDSVAHDKLDSLSTVVGALDRQTTANLRNSYGADTLDAKADRLGQAAASSSDSLLVQSLRNQIQELNQSLAQVRTDGLNQPVSQPARAPEKTTEASRTIYFAINKASLTPADKRHMLDVVEKLKANAALKLMVSGYADRTGNAAYNLVLSKKRAENIVKYLTNEAGIAPERIQVSYHGQDGKAGTTITNDPYQRRVELQLTEE